jgi:hypothetical protein
LLVGSEENHEKPEDNVSDEIRNGNAPSTGLGLYRYEGLLDRNVFYSWLHVLDGCQHVVKQKNKHFVVVCRLL